MRAPPPRANRGDTGPVTRLTHVDSGAAPREPSALARRRALERGDVRVRDMLEASLAGIRAAQPNLRAFVTLTPDLARRRADAMDRAGRRPSLAQAPIWGLPVADKDLWDRRGVPTSFGSRPAFEAGQPAASSSPIVRALDRAGGVSVGKTNVPEFGMPCYCRNALPGGPARNPWGRRLDPGGSSGGAAVAVSAGLLPVAPGNDGGGSVRIPAAACGLVGIKPSRGRVLAQGGQDGAGGLVTAGALARSVGDAALLLDAMCVGSRGEPAFSLRPPDARTTSFLAATQERPGRLSLGWNEWSPWSERYPIEVDEAWRDAARRALAALSEAGHDVNPAPAPHVEGYVEAFRALWMGGAATLPVHGEALERTEAVTRWLVRTGRDLDAGAVVAGLETLARFERSVIAAYAPFDAVVTPALAESPRPLDWYDAADGERNFVQQCQYTPFTSYVNVAGLPAITVPVGADPLPVGVQIIGRPGGEATLLRLAAQLERHFHGDQLRPPRWW